MDIQQRMKDLDARIAARKDAIDSKLGLAQAGGPSSPTAATPSATRLADTPPSSPDVPTDPELNSVSAPTGKVSVPQTDKTNDCFNTVGSIVLLVLFVLTCLLALVTLAFGMYAAFAESLDPHGRSFCVRICANIGAGFNEFMKHSLDLDFGFAYKAAKSKPWLVLLPFFCEAGFAYLLWWLHNKKRQSTN